MLLGLRISSFAVIDEVEVAFGPGLSVLTGETGAGKSILVDALGLLVGGRADPDVVRAGAEEAVAEGLFTRDDVLAARLAELGIPDLGEEISVRRVVGRGGRGKAYVNGSLVTVGVLARLMKGRVDIAGQHEHVSLFDPALHRRLLDRYGEVDDAAAAYAERWAALREVDRQILDLGGDEKTVRDRVEFLRYQLDELARVDPRPGEDLALEDERRKRASVEKLRHAAHDAEALLTAQDGAAYELISRAQALVGDAARLDPVLLGIWDRIGGALAEMDEAIRGLSKYSASLDADPARLAEVEDRLDVLKRLCKKHAVPLEELVSRRNVVAEELERLDNRSGKLEELQKARAAAFEKARESATALTRARGTAAKTLSTEITRALAQLAMPRCTFEVQVRPAPELGPDGADDIEFFFSANPGEPARPLARVASGGEASRVLLALKRVLAGSDECACYVLDEADAGVSGAVAEVVGRMIKDVSSDRQVLCITHLPQVAAYADHHLAIRKEQERGRTVSRVTLLDQEEQRARELARMLSGVEVTREAMGAAEALMRSARSAHRSLQSGARRTRRRSGTAARAAS